MLLLLLLLLRLVVKYRVPPLTADRAPLLQVFHGRPPIKLSSNDQFLLRHESTSEMSQRASVAPRCG
jgi:hypothetical protein